MPLRGFRSKSSSSDGPQPELAFGLRTSSGIPPHTWPGPRSVPSHLIHTYPAPAPNRVRASVSEVGEDATTTVSSHRDATGDSGQQVL